MHEMSIAKNIIDIIHTAMPDVGRTHVERVAVEIGEMSAVAIPSLEFCFQAATEGGPLQDARLDVRIVPIRMECHFCGFEFNVENHDFRCSRCGSGDLKELSGNELIVREVEVTE